MQPGIQKKSKLLAGESQTILDQTELVHTKFYSRNWLNSLSFINEL